MTRPNPYTLGPIAMSRRHFVVLDEPTAKGRPRVVRDARGNSRSYTPARTKRAEERIRSAIAQQLPADWTPIDIPVSLSFTAYRAMPSSIPKRDRETAEPATRPDLPNFAMLLADALTGLVWTDDSRIVEMVCRKTYVRDEHPPRWEITVASWSRVG